jgi:hypothetical protein
MLNALSVHHEVANTGDWRLGEQLMLTKPPEKKSVVPAPKLEAGRNLSKAMYQQDQRTGDSKTTTRQRRAGWFTTVGRGGRGEGRGGEGGGNPKGRGKGRGGWQAGAAADPK